jgi:hypothetical protein
MKNKFLILLVALALGVSAAPKKSEAAIVGLATGFAPAVAVAAGIGLPGVYTIVAVTSPFILFDGIYGQAVFEKTFGYGKKGKQYYIRCGSDNSKICTTEFKVLTKTEQLQRIILGIVGLTLITLDDNKQSAKFQPISSQLAIKANISKAELTSWNDNVESLNGITDEIAEESKYVSKKDANQKLVKLGVELIGDYGISAQDFKNIRSVLSKQMN